MNTTNKTAVEEVCKKLNLGDYGRTIIEQAIDQAQQQGEQIGVERERERIEKVLKKWIPTDPMGYGVNLASKGMHLDDHKRNFAKSILKAIQPTEPLVGKEEID